MANIIAIVSATPNTETQNLFTVEYTDSWREGVNGVPFYQGLGATDVLFYNINESNGTSIIPEGPVEGQPFAGFNLYDANIPYILSATLNCNVAGATYAWCDSTGAVLPNTTASGDIAAVNTPLQTMFIPTHEAGATEVKLVVFPPAGSDTFSCPAQISNVRVILQELPPIQLV